MRSAAMVTSWRRPSAVAALTLTARNGGTLTTRGLSRPPRTVNVARTRTGRSPPGTGGRRPRLGVGAAAVRLRWGAVVVDGRAGSEAPDVPPPLPPHPAVAGTSAATTSGAAGAASRRWALIPSVRRAL